jgi:hypothetical protein
MPNTKDDDVRRDVLNRLVLKPRMKEAARNAGIHPTTLFGWIKQSLTGDPKMVLTWLGHEAPFHLPGSPAALRIFMIALGGNTAEGHSGTGTSKVFSVMETRQYTRDSAEIPEVNKERNPESEMAM